ncbi:MAG: hypothetical protein CM1200mP27_00550 [Chloroflexota bacterium]|nr:MAG: hypothetical protein CM1200mP27_00550 [Chloroflexota bacterium]
MWFGVLLPLDAGRATVEHHHNASSFETLRGHQGYSPSTTNLITFGNPHVSLFNPVVAAKQMVTTDHMDVAFLGFNIVCGLGKLTSSNAGVNLPDTKTVTTQRAQKWVDVISKVGQKMSLSITKGIFIRGERPKYTLNHTAVPNR